MDTSKRNSRKEIEQLIYNGMLHQAIGAISRSGDFLPRFEQSIMVVEETYKFMLKYTVQGMSDPNRDTIFRQLQLSLLMLNDSVHHFGLSNNFSYSFPSLSSAKRQEQNPDKSNISNWFNYIVMADQLPKDVIDILQQSISDSQLSVDYKTLIVSALILSSLTNFDIEKYSLLVDFYLTNEEDIWQRALVGIVILSYFYDDRLKLYKETQSLIDKLVMSPNFKRRYEATVLQLIRAINTGKITQKIENEIIPEMKKIVPSIKNKIKDDFMKGENFEEKNPDWQEYIQDNIHENQSLMDKMSEMSKLQMEGGDVFINTFSMLKNFDFFDKIENWFLPYNPKNENIQELIKSGTTKDFNYAKFAQQLKNAMFICNSDKYSFCLSVGEMPESQRKTFGNYITTEFNEMGELSKEEQLLHKEQASYRVIVQYMQDLYRFFKLNELGKLYEDVFAESFSPSGGILFESTFVESKERRKIGEFFFENECYHQAYSIFSSISKIDPNFEVFQKMGYSAQKFNDVNLALDCFLKADLFEGQDVWNLKKIGWCYRKLNEPEKALEYYKKAEIIKSDNLSLSTAIGRCYVECDRYEDALKYYYKVEYLDEKNTKVFRPIAWCNYQLDKLDQALKYFSKISEKDLEPTDYVIMGNIYRKKEDKKTASEYYLKSLNTSNSFTSDELREYIENDLNPQHDEKLTAENNLIVDYVLFELDELIVSQLNVR